MARMSLQMRSRASPSNSAFGAAPPSHHGPWLSSTLNANCAEMGTWKANNPGREEAARPPALLAVLGEPQTQVSLYLSDTRDSCSSRSSRWPASVRWAWPATPTGLTSTHVARWKAPSAAGLLPLRRQMTTLRTLQVTRHWRSPQKCAHLSALDSSSTCSVLQVLQLPATPMRTSAACRRRAAVHRPPRQPERRGRPRPRLGTRAEGGGAREARGRGP
mmetsp:Transcript_116352/g.324195  ORF Transcript_116352/g.324195 Transcript_116352/m.324195 type:complete len:218 (+) Transcript_116352:562-1215(+)